MPHNIIDNREEKLSEHIGSLLDNAERAKFAVGYFFLSGFKQCFNLSTQDGQAFLHHIPDHPVVHESVAVDQDIAKGYDTFMVADIGCRAWIDSAELIQGLANDLELTLDTGPE